MSEDILRNAFDVVKALEQATTHHNELNKVCGDLKRDKVNPNDKVRAQVALIIVQYVENILLEKPINTIPELLKELRRRANLD